MTNPLDPARGAVTLHAITAAEDLAGLSYTDAERQLMLDGVQAQVELALRRRLVALPWDLGPATRFDPRLPGFAMPEPGPFRWQPPDLPLPEDEADIAFAPMAALAGWIKARRITAARLTRLYLDRIERHNPRLLCFATVLAERALAEAAALDAALARGDWLGPLHGIPYGLKDILDTAGIETSWGAETHRGRVPDRDSFVAEALRRAGAVLLGKTSVGALAYGDLWHGGRTRNPWNPAEGSSGSSAGSASAVAAGLAGFAIGTETLGSIVAPCARCGTAGLRPTYGRVSRRGAMPLCWSLDKIGTIGRVAEDTVLALAALAAPDPADLFQIPAPLGYDAQAPVAGLRVGWFEEDWTDPLDQVALEAARGFGMQLVPLQRRLLPYDSLRAVLHAEAAASFEELTLTGRDDELAWQEADAWPSSFRRARFLSAVDHVQLDRFRRLVMQEMGEAFRSVDLILGPSLAGPMTLITNFTGHPCLTLRAGFRLSPTRGRSSLLATPGPAPGGTPQRVPHPISLWGRLFDEGRLVAAGRALEAALGAWAERPAL